MTPPPVTLMQSAKNIRSAREAQALSQEALARLVGVSVRTVARWESGLSQPSSLALEKLRQTVPGVDERR
jgi:DNA-binding transcriptional regulator YiaG